MDTYNDRMRQEISETLLERADNIIVQLQMLEMGARALQRAALNVPIRKAAEGASLKRSSGSRNHFDSLLAARNFASSIN